MSVTLQIELNGGAPQVGGVTGAIGDVVQLTAANKSTWGGAARWEIYDYPPSFTVPSGWTADGDGVFYVLGNADPPAFTISDADDWGKYGFRVTVLDGAVLATDDATALSIPSAGGIKSIMAGEGAQFGGTRERWVKDLKSDLRALAAGSGGGAGTVTPDPDELVLRDNTGQAFATAFVGPSNAQAVVRSQAGYVCRFTSGNANYVFDDDTSPTPVARTVLVCAESQSFVTCSSTLGFRMRAAEHTFSATSASAITGSVTVQSTASELIVASKGAAKPLVLRQTGAADIEVDLPAEGRALKLQVADVDALSVTPTAGKVTFDSPNRTVDLNTKGGVNGVEVNSGRDVLVDHAAGRATIVSENGTQVVRMQEPQTSVTANTKTLTCSSDGTTFLCATDGPMRIQPAAPGSGAGRKLTFGGSPGAIPGTDLAGGTDLLLGQVVSNNSAPLDIYAGATHLCQVRGTLATYTEISHQPINSALLLRALASGSQVWAQANNRVLLRQENASAGFVDIASSRQRWYTASEGRLVESKEAGSATIASATTTNVVTYATTSNRVYQVWGKLTVSNDTDNELAAYWVRAAFKNVAGTVTQTGATQTIAADLEDAGQTGLSAVLDFSGTTIRLRLQTDAGDTVNADGTLELNERVLV